MNIIFRQEFLIALDSILEFIAKDSVDRAVKFHDELYGKLYDLGFMPYKFRRSLSFDDENIRDFIFKGYVIPYLVDKRNDTIAVLGIFKENTFKTLQI